jgi:hypothetical protein
MVVQVVQVVQVAHPGRTLVAPWSHPGRTLVESIRLPWGKGEPPASMGNRIAPRPVSRDSGHADRPADADQDPPPPCRRDPTGPSGGALLRTSVFFGDP